MQNNDEKILVKEQIKKFAIRSMYGFQTVMTYGLGSRLGIFEYLNNKAISQKKGEKVESVSFTLNELSKNLNLDLKFLDGWFHMALECGLFEIEDHNKEIAKTAPFIYDILINPNSMVYIGNMIGGFYGMTLFQDEIYENFKTGKIQNLFEFPLEFLIMGHKMSTSTGLIIERLFSKYCKENKRNLQKNGIALEVGCGCGFNIINWASKYKRAKFIGIDIDPNAISYASQLIKEKDLSNRVNVQQIPLEEFQKKSQQRFDVIILNQVLHEMNPDEKYRNNVFAAIHSLLKDDGLFIVGESMIPDTFAPNQKNQLFNIMHKYLEVGFWSRFYDEDTFLELINSSPFKSADLIKEGSNYFWAVRK